MFEFPVRSPDGALLRAGTTAISQLEHWRDCKTYYTEHNPSCTIYVRENEWMEVGAWVYKHWADVGGISFLPYDGGVYNQPPYEELTESEFIMRLFRMPIIDNFSEELCAYAQTDHTEMSREFQCTGDRCDL